MISTLKSIKFIREYFFKRKGLVFLTTSLIVFSSMLSLPIPYLSSYIVDDVLIKGNMSLLFKIVLFTIILVILQMITGMGISYLISLLSQSIVSSFRLNLHKKILLSDNNDIKSLDPGHSQTVIFNDADLVGNGFLQIFWSILSNTIMLILYCVVLININIKLALISFSTLPIFIILFKLFGKKLQALSSTVQSSKDRMFSTLLENLNGKKNILIYNAFIQRNNIFKKDVFDLKHQTVKLTTLNSFLEILFSLISLIGPFSILIYGAVLVEQNFLSIGKLIAFYSYVTLMYPPLMELISIYPKIQILSAPISRINSILIAEEPKKNLFEFQIKNNKERINVENVCYTNPSGKLVFENMNFKISLGEKVLIKGDNGSGKTTLLEIILGLRKPDSGNVIIGNTDISNMRSEKLFNLIGYVPQESYFFRGSIWDNLTLGLNNIDRGRVEDLLKDFNLYTFVNSLDKKLDTEIDKIMTNLSGGQLQKIKIIRALLQNPTILMIDEAFSNIDERSLISILDHLKEKCPNISILLVNHGNSPILENFIDKTYTIENLKLEEKTYVFG